MFKINDVSQKCDDVVGHAEQFLPFAHKKMGFSEPVDINLLSDPKNAKNPLGKTAYYNPNEMKIVVFIDKRHIKDIMRSLAHELVHHTQNCRGDLSGDNYTGPGYAQKDKHMRKMEGEAYLMGNLCFRDWEDSLKKENSAMNETKLRKYVRNLITEALDEDKLEEGDPTKRFKGGAAELPKAPGTVQVAPPSKKKVKPDPARDAPPTEKELEKLKGGVEDLPEENLNEEGGMTLKYDSLPADLRKLADEAGEGGAGKTYSVQNAKDQKHALSLLRTRLQVKIKRKEKVGQNESWYRGNKDNLLFERLIKKWTK